MSLNTSSSSASCSSTNSAPLNVVVINFCNLAELKFFIFFTSGSLRKTREALGSLDPQFLNPQLKQAVGFIPLPHSASINAVNFVGCQGNTKLSGSGN